MNSISENCRGNYKRCNMCNGNTRRRMRERTRIFEVIMNENFPKLITNTKPQILEAKRSTSRINPKENLH